jgi:hypothetical protein
MGEMKKERKYNASILICPHNTLQLNEGKDEVEEE